MRHRRRYERSADDLAQLGLERLSDWLASTAPSPTAQDARRLKEELREERRRRRKEESQRDLIATGAGLLAGGLSASLGLITVGAVGVGLAVGGVTAVALRWAARRAVALPKPRPRPQLEAPDVVDEGLPASRAELVRKVLAEATADLRTLDGVQAAMVDRESVAILARLVATGSRIVETVAKTPDRFAAAQRTLTYYLPRARELAENLKAQEAGPQLDEQRFAAARHVLARMENLFERTVIDLRGGDLQEMDLEIRLINDALDEDLAGKDAPKR